MVCVALTGCLTGRPAPVVERTTSSKPVVNAQAGVPPKQVLAPRITEARPEFYTVKPGDTLYSIALEHGLDYRDLALWNGLDNPGSLRVGQQLRVVGQPSAVVAAPLKTPGGGAVEAKPLGVGPSAVPLPPPIASGPGVAISEPKAVRLPYSEQAWAQLAKPETSVPVRPDPVRTDTRPEPKVDPSPEPARASEDIGWTWPVKGKILATFNGTTSKGVDIAGKRGQPVLASAAGRVIFSGTGVRGMGKFVVIKHSEAFISVYAHNDELLVKYGQTVARGQKIAEMGNSDADQVKLHFEIRRLGSPVDPLKLLPEEPA
ncbi:MAG: peptidoglycan DD-metalloendopeptidase family protein [Burkholderiales bacterium]